MGDMRKANGTELIAAARIVLDGTPGWSVEDADQAHGEMAWAAVCYASPTLVYLVGVGARDTFSILDPWPWDVQRDGRHDWNKGSRHSRPLAGQERIEELAKAGAFIAAEIDRLQAVRLTKATCLCGADWVGTLPHGACRCGPCLVQEMEHLPNRWGDVTWRHDKVAAGGAGG